MFYKIINAILRFGLILSFFSIQAQMYPDLVEYIVTTEGDTTMGEVRVFTSYNVEFRAKGSRDFIKVDPYKVKRAIEGENFSYVSEDLTYNEITSRVFLKELISGDVAFYEFLDSSHNPSYYVRKTNDKFRRLNTSNYNFIKNALLLNCDSLPPKKTKFTSDFRFNIVADQISMHNAKCSSVENPFIIKYGGRKRSYFELIAGLMVTSFKETYSKRATSSSPGMSGVINETRVCFTIGIGYQLGFNRYLFWNPQVLYTNIGGNIDLTPNGLFSYRDPNGTLHSKNVSLSSHTVDLIPLQLILRTNKYKLNPNLSIGGGLRFNTGLMLSFGLGFDYYLSSRQFLKVLLNYKIFDALSSTYNYKDENYYGHSTFGDSYFNLTSSSLGLTVSYLLK